MISRDFDLVYCCDAYPAIGMGHLKRGLDVVTALCRRRSGLRVAYSGEFSESARRFLAEHEPAGVPFLPPGWAWTARVTVVDTMFDADDPEYVDERICVQARATCDALVLVLGVLAVDLPAGVDVLVNHLPDVRVSGIGNPRLLLGFDYAPVSASLLDDARRGVSHGAARLLAIVGGNVEQDGPEVLLNLFRGLEIEELDLIVSPHFPGKRLERIRADNLRVRVDQNVPSLAPFFDAAAAVVCTYGNATYESLALHKPTYLLNYKEFQESYGDYLESKGLVVNFGRFEAPRIERIVDLISEETRARLSGAARRAFAEAGIEKIVDVLLEENDRVQVAS